MRVPETFPEKHQAFLVELKALLEKYNATIGFDVGDGSDTYGLYDARMEVSFSGDWGPYHRLCDGWGVGASDIVLEEETT